MGARPSKSPRTTPSPSVGRQLVRAAAAGWVSVGILVSATGCGPPKYRYHFSTKGGADRFPIASEATPAQADGGVDGRPAAR
jgi:hypothetical protein